MFTRRILYENSCLHIAEKLKQIRMFNLSEVRVFNCDIVCIGTTASSMQKQNEYSKYILFSFTSSTESDILGLFIGRNDACASVSKVLYSYVRRTSEAFGHW